VGSTAQRAVWHQSGAEWDQAILWRHEVWSAGVDPNSVAAPFNVETKPALNEYYARPASRHPGGFVVAFCDGRTLFVGENVDYSVYARLMTSRGRDFIVPGLETKGNFQSDPRWSQGTNVRTAQSVPVSEAELNP